jgi:carbonic anhydrase/acetyltransferase-like protein (isoleucine patch superfamily)
MSRTLTVQDRSSLIRLASTLPAGSAERRVLLAAAGGDSTQSLKGGTLVTASTLTVDHKVGDGVTFFHLPIKKNDVTLKEFYDLPFMAKGVVVGKKEKFTSYGTQLFVPFYDIELPDGRVMHEVNPYYFHSEWPKSRDNFEDAFKVIMKALKPLDLKRTRSEMRAGKRVLSVPLGVSISFERTLQLLRSIPGVKIGGAAFPSTPFTISMRSGESSYANYEGAVDRRGFDSDELYGLTLDRVASGRMAHTSAPRALTASDRGLLVRLASEMPNGSSERRAIIAGLSVVAVSLGEFNIPNFHIVGQAAVTDDAKVYDKAQIRDGAQVYGRAKVHGEARVFGKAHVYQDAEVFMEAQVYDYAKVGGRARVYGVAEVHGDAAIWGNAQISDGAKVFGNAQVYGDAKVSDWAKIGGDAEVFGKAQISGRAVILGGTWDGSEGEILSGRWLAPGVPA